LEWEEEEEEEDAMPKPKKEPSSMKSLCDVFQPTNGIPLPCTEFGELPMFELEYGKRGAEEKGELELA
jgi:hypothetical protein